jgi:hypothetical protein
LFPGFYIDPLIFSALYSALMAINESYSSSLLILIYSVPISFTLIKYSNLGSSFRILV